MTDTHYQDVYRQHAAEYDELVNAEDCDHVLLPAIDKLASVAGAAVLDVGAGTGRLTRLLAGQDARMFGVELSAAMLRIARQHLPGVSFAQADARALPLKPAWADIAIAGWVFGHFNAWFAGEWHRQIDLALDAMEYTIRPGGLQIIIETLGTGFTEPTPPPSLIPYFDWLEHARGFTRVELRTDYCFPDAETAARVTGFFFGAEFAARVRREQWARVPECTGLWWRRL
jgi:ubiquinone/menaquinone biosynthesis C-methylase UbiE